MTIATEENEITRTILDAWRLLRSLAAALLRHRGKASLAFLAGLAATAASVLLVKPGYEAHATLLVKFGQQYVYLPGEVSSRAGTPSREGIIATEIEILNSLALARHAVQAIGPRVLYPAGDDGGPATNLASHAAAHRLRGSLSVRAKGDSGVITVALRHPDAILATRALITLIDAFMARHQDIFGNPGAVEFLERQVAGYAGQLTASEEALEAFRTRFETPSAERESGLLLQERAELETEVNRVAGDIARARGKLAELREVEGTVPRESVLYAGTGSSDITQKATDRLLDLQVMELQLRSRLSEENPEVINIRKEMQLVSDFLESQRKEDRVVERIAQSEVYVQWQQMLLEARTDVPALEEQERVLLERIAAINARLLKLVKAEKDEARLRRDAALAESHYREYAERLEEARAFRQMEAQKLTNISVIEPPVSPAEPVGARRKIRLAVGVFFSAAAAALVALLAAFLEAPRMQPS